MKEPDRSALERARAGYEPRVPPMLKRRLGEIAVEPGEATTALDDREAIRRRFPRTFGQPILRFVRATNRDAGRPRRVGVVFSGGQAPGGHNVITGLFDALRRGCADSVLYGFLGGPKGVLAREHRELDGATVDRYRNTGGFDMIGSGRDKIETGEQIAACGATCRELRLDGLVIVGGDDSNTNAAILAEHFVELGVPASVVGVPKTIDGDLKGERIEASFGFDTATKVYSELVGNICRDAASAGKYWHFIKLMGRSASHVTLECALRTRPNIALLGEEIHEKGLTFEGVVAQVAEAIRARAEAGVRHGVCLVPEGLIEFIPEIRALILELNTLLADRAEDSVSRAFVLRELTNVGSKTFRSLPDRIQEQLLLDRDAHGNVQVSKIDTEALLAEKVGERFTVWRDQGRFSGRFQSQHHFFGYEGRCAAPSNFDADYTYSLGHVAAVLIANRSTGYISAIGGLSASPEAWRAMGVPLVSLMQLESRKGKPTPVVGKALVQLDGEPFLSFAASRGSWERKDHYLFPGSIQYFGPPEVCDLRTRTLLLEHGEKDPDV